MEKAFAGFEISMFSIICGLALFKQEFEILILLLNVST